MPAAKPVQLERPIKFDDAMRALVKMEPPPTGKKAQRNAVKKKVKRKSR